MEFSVQTNHLILDAILNLIIFGGGFWMLVRGSDLFVDSASDLARCWKVPELVIGLTLVSIGTSLPELASSVYAAFCNQPDFIVGNIAGSGTANILLILGLGIAFSSGLSFNRKLFSRDTVMMNLIFIITLLMILFGTAVDPQGNVSHGINRWCGFLLFAGAVFYCWNLFKSGDAGTEENPSGRVAHGTAFLLMMSAVSLVMIVSGSKMLVDTVVWGACRMKVSSLLISVTIVAFGTSVPELAVTIAGIRKGLHDLVLGNIVGSCIFNVLMIFGLCALIRPLAVIGTAGLVNVTIMLISGLLLLASMAVQKKLSRFTGILFLVCYTLFVIYNVWDSLKIKTEF